MIADEDRLWSARDDPYYPIVLLVAVRSKSAAHVEEMLLSGRIAEDNKPAVLRHLDELRGDVI